MTRPAYPGMRDASQGLSARRCGRPLVPVLRKRPTFGEAKAYGSMNLYDVVLPGKRM